MPVSPRRVVASYLKKAWGPLLSDSKPRNKTACIVAAGNFEGHNCLLKVRDRNYVPSVRIIRELIDGVEVAYLHDHDTDWSEGINEFGVGVVSAALMVIDDETVKEERVKAPDGLKIRKILTKKTLSSAVSEAVKNGVTGHTFISTPIETAIIEMDGEQVGVRTIDSDNGVAVRTNHGDVLEEAGYTSGPKYLSSKTRQQTAERILSKVKRVDAIGQVLPQNRYLDRENPNNMIRDTKDMMSTSIGVIDCETRTMKWYMIPGRVNFFGVENRLPKGRKPQINLEFYTYSAEEWAKDKPKPVLMEGNFETFRLFTYGSLMSSPVYEKDVVRSYPATLSGYHRAYNRNSQSRGDTLVIGTEKGGDLQGVVHEYPVEVAHRLLGQMDRREGFNTDLEVDKNAYLRGYVSVTDNKGKEVWVVTYLSNPESKNYFAPLSEEEAARRILKQGDKPRAYLRELVKAMDAYQIEDEYIRDIHTEVSSGRSSS